MKIKLAVIGDPIGHSLSPLIHTTVLDTLGTEYEYEKIRVSAEELENFMMSDKAKSLDGFNVTMPHKENIIKFMDDIDEEAKRCGAVNTVKVKNGRFFGYNTDGNGYIRSLAEMGLDLKGKRVTVLGAGGAASTVMLKAASVGAAKISVLNRTIGTAQEAADAVFAKTGVKTEVFSLDGGNLRECCGDCDVLINGTPLGMTGVDADFEDLSFLEEINKGGAVSDLIYNPPKTALLKEAERLGLRTINGLGMLIYQGIAADEIYLGRELDGRRLKDIIFEKYAEERRDL